MRRTSPVVFAVLFVLNSLAARADVALEPDLRERYQALAPAVDDGLYLVPKVLE